MDNKETLAQKYNLDIDDFKMEYIDDIPFNVRTHKCLKHVEIKTVAELLSWSEEELSGLKGFGQGCRNEIENYLNSKVVKKSIREIKIMAEIKKFLPDILNGEFGFENQLSEGAQKKIFRYKEAIDKVDIDLIKRCLYETQAANYVRISLKSFYNMTNSVRKIKDQIQKANGKRLRYLTEYFVNAYTEKNDTKRILLSEYTKSISLEKYIIELYTFDKIDENIEIKEKFVKWCGFNVKEEICQYVKKLQEKEREYEIVCARASGMTLKQVGQQFGVTKERVRQVIVKVQKQFNIWQQQNRILMKIYADLGGDSFLTENKISGYFGENVTLLNFLCKTLESREFIFDPQLDVFIIGDESMAEKVQQYVELLPDAFHRKELCDFITIAYEEKGLSYELVKIAVQKNYKQTGELYHRNRLTREMIYAKILGDFYPNGMHVYDRIELARFRELINQEYKIKITTSDRAMSAVLARIGILCGRGCYRLNNQSFISNDLAEKIREYIESNEAPIFLTNSIFQVFKDKLVEQGIDNKYFLQGILHERYGDQWIFRRDYISKDKEITSVYGSIVSFIEHAKHPVDKKEINRFFPGLPEIVLNFSVSDPEILNLFGAYIHSNKLKISNSEINYLRNKIKDSLVNEGICHCKKIYEIVDRERPELLKNNYVFYPFSMYSLLEYLFRDDYNFSRPFVARKGIEIETINERLKMMMAEKNSITVDEIMNFARMHHFVIYNILDFIDSCNETHLLVNDMDVKRIEVIGMDETIAFFIENKICKEIQGTMPISNLQCINEFPKICVPWTEWLIYSVIKKWSLCLEVAPSANQFRQAIPLIAPKGELKRDNFENIDKRKIGNMVMADDIEDIDNLISDYVIEDIGGSDEL